MSELVVIRYLGKDGPLGKVEIIDSSALPKGSFPSGRDVTGMVEYIKGTKEQVDEFRARTK